MWEKRAHIDWSMGLPEEEEAPTSRIGNHTRLMPNLLNESNDYIHTYILAAFSNRIQTITAGSIFFLYELTMIFS